MHLAEPALSQHFKDVFEMGNADAALAASIFHFREIPIPDLKIFSQPINTSKIMKPSFAKYTDGLLPVIVQDYITNKVLMLGFMNEAAFEQTQKESKVTFLAAVNKDCGPKAKLQETFY